jgi:hypothetical protein
MRVGGGVVGDSGYRTADAANGDERRPLRCPGLGKDLKDLGHRFLVDKCASGYKLNARRRGHSVHERVRIGFQRDIVAGHRAEPADRADCLGRELRVIAVKGDVDPGRRFGPAGEWIGIAQNSSGFSSALACTTSALAVTTSAAATLSRARPYFLTFQPMPPVNVTPTRGGEAADAGLRELLAADVHMVGDGGGTAPQLATQIIGAENVARMLAWLVSPFVRIGGVVEPHQVNGQPGAILRDRGGKVLNALALDILDGQIQTIRTVINPDKLGHVGPVGDAWAVLREANQARLPTDWPQEPTGPHPGEDVM